MSDSAQITLFRREVAQAQSAQWLGVVRLQRSVSFSLATCCAFGVGLLLVAFATWGEVNRKSHLSGLLIPTLGTLAITTSQSGTVVQLPVTEGQNVQAGDVLAIVNAEHKNLREGVAEDTLARVASQIDARQQTFSTERTLRELQTQQRQSALQDRIRTLRAELRKASEECSLQERRVQLAQTTLSRSEQLAKEGFVSAAEVQSRHEESIDAQIRLQSGERMRLGVQQDLQALMGEQLALAAQLKADINQLERNRASLDQEATENMARKSLVVTAPFSGQVTALDLKLGQSVQAGQTLLTLMPSTSSSGSGATQLQAHLYAPSHTAGFLRPGQTVYVRYAAYPYQKFGLYEGQITAVSSTPFAPNELPPNLAQQLVSQAGSNEALFRVNVHLLDQSVRAYGQEIALKPGLTLEADVLQESRKVWEWIFEPLLAARQKVRVL